MPFPRWVVIYGMECRSGAQARARSVPPGIWAQNSLVARRAEAGRRDREKFSAKLMSCRAEADGTLDGGEAEDNEEKRVCRVALLVTHAKAC